LKACDIKLFGLEPTRAERTTALCRNFGVLLT